MRFSLITPFARRRACGCVVALRLRRAGAERRSSPTSRSRRSAQIVQDYLLKNPEILQEVMAELEKRQAEAAARRADERR